MKDDSQLISYPNNFKSFKHSDISSPLTLSDDIVDFISFILIINFVFSNILIWLTILMNLIIPSNIFNSSSFFEKLMISFNNSFFIYSSFSKNLNSFRVNSISFSILLFLFFITSIILLA